MRLFGYYAWHSFVNQLKKLFKTWVLIFLLACMLIGGVIGLGAAKLSNLAEEQAEEAGIVEELPGEDGEDEPSFLESQGLDATAVLDLALSVGLLALLAYETLSADKNGSKIFLPADVNLLFASPMKPQSVLMFRLGTQLGAAIAMTVYLLLQLPNLTLNMGLSLWAALALIVTWGLAILIGKLIQVLLYLVCAEHPGFKNNLRRIVYALLAVLLLGFILRWKTGGETPLAAAAHFFGAPVTRYVPLWGWLKGFCLFASEGDLVGTLVSFALIILGAAALAWVISRMHADFYEDAMAKSEEMAELLAAARSEKANGIVRKRKKDRSDKLRRDGMKHGWGAGVFFFKPLYNRFRFAHLGVFTKTTETYLAAALGTAALCRFVLDTRSFVPVALALAALAFFRSLGNPLAEDTKMDFFRLVPESTWAKLICSLLAGTVNCVLDALPGLILAALLVGENPLAALAWLPLIASVDFYGTAVGSFIDLSVPVSAGKTIKQIVQAMFIYFGLLPDIAIMAVGIVMDRWVLAAVICALLNFALGLLFFFLAGGCIDPKGGRSVVRAAEGVDLGAAKKQFSRMGLAAAVILAVTSAAQVLLSALLRSHAGEPWFLWVVSFAPLYLAGVPAGLLILRGVPAQRPESRPLQAKHFAGAFLVTVFMMYAGNIVGTLIVQLLQSGTSAPVNNPLESYIGEGSMALQVLCMVVLAPIIEEFVFRRVLIDRVRPYGEKLAVFVSAALFALFHGNLQQMFYAFTIGLVFGCVYLLTGRLRYTVALHMLVNFLGSVVAPWVVGRAAEDGLEAIGSFDFSAFSDGVPAGLALFGGYLLAMLAMGVAGLVLLIHYAPRLRFQSAPYELPKGTRFRTAFLNPGMLLMLLICIGMIALNMLI